MEGKKGVGGSLEEKFESQLRELIFFFFLLLDCWCMKKKKKEKKKETTMKNKTWTDVWRNGHGSESPSSLSFVTSGPHEYRRLPAARTIFVTNFENLSYVGEWCWKYYSLTYFFLLFCTIGIFITTWFIEFDSKKF